PDPKAFIGKHYPQYEEFIENTIRDHNLQPSYGTIKKGQALLWASNLLHGGSKVRDPKRTRQSQVTHYFFEGCTYYTPMLSQKTKLFLRQPNWIPKTSPL